MREHCGEIMINGEWIKIVELDRTTLEDLLRLTKKELDKLHDARQAVECLNNQLTQQQLDTIRYCIIQETGRVGNTYIDLQNSSKKRRSNK